MIISRGGWPAPGRLTVLLRALAETPDLRLRVLVGEDALDRTVDGVFTTDLVDPRRRHRLPLLEVPVDVSFAAITERVLAARLHPAGPGPAAARIRALASGRAAAGPGSSGRAASLAEV